MADDQPARIELMKLKAIVGVMADAFANLSYRVEILFSSSNILIAENPAEVSTKICTDKVMIMLRHDANGSFGIFFPDTTSSAADGVNIIADLLGKKFVLFQ